MFVLTSANVCDCPYKRTGRRRSSIRLVAWLIAVICPFGRATADSPLWWDNYPIIVQGDISWGPTYHADVSFNGSLNAPGWGTYGQKIADAPNDTATVHNQGRKSICYYETFGQSFCFIGELGTNNGDFQTIKHTHWGWQGYSGGTIVWVGAQNFFDDEPFARPYTRTHPIFGGPPMKYPDGTVATGYNGPSTDPRNSRVFDAGCSKNILGVVAFDYEPSNGTVQTSGPHTGLFQIGGTWTGLFFAPKDSACPMWINLDSASTLLSASQGMDGMWSDNFSPWDSFNARPVERAFGDWSVALFRSYLSSTFSPSELLAMGINDVTTFDVLAALRAQCVTWGGDDTDINSPVWQDSRWLDIPIWHAYVIFKRQKGTEALTNYYNGVKQAASSAGKTSFLVAGNDIPVISLGWARGNLDMVSAESTPGWSLDGGPRGFMLPPAGRLAPQYKLAREHAKSRLVNSWMYLNDNLISYRGKSQLSTTMMYEMLATNTLPMDLPEFTKWAFTPASAQAFNTFVQTARTSFGPREAVEEIGIYYSSSSLLAFMTPGGALDFANQPHQFAYYGWATALDELHYQYRAVPEWKFDAQTLSGLKALIIPNAVVLDPSDVTNVLVPWVQNGG